LEIEGDSFKDFRVMSSPFFRTILFSSGIGYFSRDTFQAAKSASVSERHW